MRGVRWLRPVRPIGVPSWDLSVVLEGLMAAPFEPLESAPERILTLKITLLLALTSLKRVGDLQALSIIEMFSPGLVKVTLRPRPGYVPNVLSESFRTQVVMLHSFSFSFLCFRWGWGASHALSCLSFEDICGPLQTLEEISQVAGVLWCWPPWTCHIETQNFSLGEGRYFAGLWGAWPSFTSQHSGTLY